MKRITPLMVIGTIILIDGMVSFIYFKDTGTVFEKSVRILRAGIGLFILLRRKKLR